MNGRQLLPSAILMGSCAFAYLYHAAARRRRPSGDCGDYWARIVRWICYGLCLPLCISAVLESIAGGFWQSGWHLHVDRVSGGVWAFPFALSLPFVVWVMFLTIALKPAAGEPGRGNWLAGSAGFTTSRKWVLLFLPLLLIPLLWFGRERLDLGATGYSAATWGTLAALSISLVGVAFSDGKLSIPPVKHSASESRTGPVPELPPWAESIAAQGIELEALATWPATPPPRAVHASAREFAERLSLLGAKGVAPQVIEAVHQLTSSANDRIGKGAACLLFAPDDCGQLESVALAASDLAIRLNETTLIITPRPDPALVAAMREWMPGSDHGYHRKTEIVSIGVNADIRGPAGIWIVDAATLSDDFMIRLTDPSVVTRLGLIVWWDVHSYTGVLAANIWAISRRLHRLVQARGKSGVRALALVRYASYADAQLARFVRRLLPYHFPAEAEVYVERSFPRTVHLYRLLGHQRYFEKVGHQSLPNRCRHVPLVAGLESARLNWPTYIEPTAEIAGDEHKEVFDMPVGERQLRSTLVSSRATAGARIRQIAAGEALSIVEILAQGGRSSRPGIPHHIAITVAGNPYVENLIGRLRGESSTIEASRRLVGAEGHEAIYRRHLLLALSELEDTLSGLLHTLLWEERVVREALEDIARENRLTHREVRYLDPVSGARRTEHLYRSTLSRHSEHRPLDTVGDRLVFVREQVAGSADGGVRMRVDPERLVIQAYPGRVFLSSGQRYRVAEWRGNPTDWVACEREAAPVSTWRVRSSTVSRMLKAGPESVMGREGLLLKKFPVEARYEEEVTYVLRRQHDLTKGTVSDARSRIAVPLTTAFDTRALILNFEPRPEESAVRSLCLALRYVIPVHVGVEEDALEIVPVSGQFVGQTRVYGLAIVDLYPRGIGLVDAIEDDQALLEKLLELTRDWLTTVTTPQRQGDPPPFASPLAQATGGEQDPRQALALLHRIAGESRPPLKGFRAHI